MPTARSAGHSATRGALLAGAALTLYLSGVGFAWSRTAVRDREANGDPVRALSSPVPSTRFTLAYWSDQAERRTVLWQQARALCGGTPVASNCGPVNAVEALRTLREVRP